MIEFRKNEIKALANKLTCNSELFGDEIMSVISQLTSANEFGCSMEGKISTCWGGSISVVALPNKVRHNWTF